MLLYEIYGKDLFKITKYEIDILRYRPKSVLLAAMAGGAPTDDFGGYIEDGSSSSAGTLGGVGVGRTDQYDTDRDIRINIPEENMNESGNLLSTGIRWLFGA
jgi:hypothetical protein